MKFPLIWLPGHTTAINQSLRQAAIFLFIWKYWSVTKQQTFSSTQQIELNITLSSTVGSCALLHEVWSRGWGGRNKHLPPPPPFPLSSSFQAGGLLSRKTICVQHKKPRRVNKHSTHGMWKKYYYQVRWSWQWRPLAGPCSVSPTVLFFFLGFHEFF